MMITVAAGCYHARLANVSPTTPPLLLLLKTTHLLAAVVAALHILIGNPCLATLVNLTGCGTDLGGGP